MFRLPILDSFRPFGTISDKFGLIKTKSKLKWGPQLKLSHLSY